MRTLQKAPKRLFLEIGMLAFGVPSFWTILENVSPKRLRIIEKLSEISPYPRKWAENWWRRSKIWLRTGSNGSLALTP